VKPFGDFPERFLFLLKGGMKKYGWKTYPHLLVFYWALEGELGVLYIAGRWDRMFSRPIFSYPFEHLQQNSSAKKYERPDDPQKNIEWLKMEGCCISTLEEKIMTTPFLCKNFTKSVTQLRLQRSSKIETPR